MYHWESLNGKGIESGPVKSKKICDLDYDELVSEHFQIDKSETIHCSTWAKCDGIEYHCGSVDVVDEMPLFSKIVAIILRKEEIHFVLMEMEAVYVEHPHAFQVQELDCFCIVKQDDLQHPKPFDLQMSYDS